METTKMTALDKALMLLLEYGVLEGEYDDPEEAILIGVNKVVIEAHNTKKQIFELKDEIFRLSSILDQVGLLNNATFRH